MFHPHFPDVLINRDNNSCCRNSDGNKKLPPAINVTASMA